MLGLTLRSFPCSLSSLERDHSFLWAPASFLLSYATVWPCVSLEGKRVCIIQTEVCVTAQGGASLLEIFFVYEKVLK